MLAYFLAKFHTTLLVQTACHEVVVPPNWARKDFAHEVRLLDNSSRLPFSFANSILYQMHPKNFRCVPPKRSIPILQLTVEFIGAES